MAPKTKCYGNHSNAIKNVTLSVPCGVTNAKNPHVPCCLRGDTCLSDSICSYTHSLAGGSGYYSADCTDDKFEDAACRRRCGDNPFGDVVYNSSTGIWSCCSFQNGARNCLVPSDVHFSAPAPSQLSSIVYIPATGTPKVISAPQTLTSTFLSTSSVRLASSGSSQVDIPTHTSAASVNITSSNDSSVSSSSRSIEAKAAVGIGVGAFVAFLGLVVLAYVFLRRAPSDELTPTEPQQTCDTHTSVCEAEAPISQIFELSGSAGHSAASTSEAAYGRYELE